ncbi:hypothetical protein [Spirosoma flavum]|uniref:Glycosyltransferase RgtA/B/C/D-like domain-containing protein n=1 Tax=Spirosoma flavum TaxID=2048557 RepID=A0ABW6AN58_9BACT
MQYTYLDTTITGQLRTSIADKKIGIGLFVLLTLVYGIFFIRNFSGPLAEILPGDTDQWEYMGYYLSQNLSFTPLPHLNLINDQTFFPYGTNHTFQGWSFESNMWFSANYLLFGTGPWLNIYYLLSLLTVSIGTYLLLRTDYGDRRAWLAGLIVSFLNFYALNKYPGHFAYSVIHWTVLSMLADFLLVRRIVLNTPITMRFVLLKMLLLTLCLGLDIGYVMGYALSSFALSVLFVFGLMAYRSYSQPARIGVCLRQTIAAWWQEGHSVRSIALGLATIFLAFLYVPLLIEVAHQATAFTFADRFAGGHGWMHPMRLLLPFFPGFNAINNLLVNRLHDVPEGYGAGSPGWLLLRLAITGFWYTPKVVRWAYVPLVVFFVLHLIYHPIQFPTLQIFPWCRFNRHPSRVTLIYPVIAAILALHLPTKLTPFIWIPLVIIGLLEISTVYQFRYAWKPYYFSPSFKPYMERVRQQPGEAVLDWPFCVVGGNGIGGVNGLCPLYKQTSMLYTLKRFHEKKTIGQYFGRLHISQIQSFSQAGWPQVLDHADQTDFMQADQLMTCLTKEQWVFFDNFYELNDFAGINLCVDLMPELCVKAFYTRYGQPVATTEVPGAGRVVFIPKPARDRTKVNSLLGKLVRFPCGCSNAGYVKEKSSVAVLR